MCKILVCYPKVHMIFDILNLNTILSVLFLDTRHQENPKNRGTGNPYPNQNMTGKGNILGHIPFLHTDT